MNLKDLIQNIHVGCFELCHQALGRYLPIAGNVGIFCQSEEEFATLTQICEEITFSSDNPNQKYFKLKVPLAIEQIGDIPSAIYTHLYIRKPNPNSPEAGDIDFVLPLEEYKELKVRILSGEKILGANIYDRPGWDMIEVRDRRISTLAYISTKEMAEKVRVKFD